MSQYVGKLISLVDKENVRYIGVLSSISAETSTLVLKNVTVYGTESRQSSSGEVPKENKVRPEIQFKGSDVSDLQVLESDKPSKPRQARSDKTDSQRNRNPQSFSNNQKNNNNKNSNDDDDNEDFISRTQRLASSTEAEDKAVEASAAYDKSASFFDDLGSSDTSGRSSWAQERSMNMETFGESGQSRNRGRGSRGRGRGSRGGYRGRGGRGARSDANGNSGEGESNREPTRRRERGRGRGGNDAKAQQVTEYTPGGQFA